MGFFSWNTQDTGKSIANRYSGRPTFTVYMVNPLTDEYYKEDNYEGYGVFGGKDYYELLAEMQGLGSNRDEGIRISFDNTTEIDYYPVLVEDLSKAKEYYGAEPTNCEYQGYFYPKEDTKVTITFNITNEGYNTYENILDEFMNNIIDIGGTDFEVTED